MPGTSQSTLYIFHVVKLPLCQAAGNTLKAFIFQGLPCLLQDITKMNTVYKLYKGHIATDGISAGNF